MLKQYKFLSKFVLCIIVGNVAVSCLIFFTGSEAAAAYVNLNVLTIYLAGLWVVFKLLQAHFPDKLLTISYTNKTRRTLLAALIVSGVVCAALLALDIPDFFKEGYDPQATYVTQFLWYDNLRLRDTLSPLRSLPAVILILLANVYARLFYRLARRMETQEHSKATV